MTRVLVTGGGGFIGGQLVAALRARGDEVVCLAGSERSATALVASGAQVVRGDVCDAEAVTRAARGCAVVHHLAGINSHCPADPGRLWRVNVLGPQTVVRAAARAGARRVVFTSSSGTVGEAPGTVGSETTVHRGWFLSLYEQSKLAGERAGFAAGTACGIEVVGLLPTSVQGPPRRGGNGAIVLAYLNGRLPAFVDTVISIVDVRDVVAAHLAAETRGAAGDRFVLSPPAIDSATALALLGSLSGVPRRVRIVPAGVARRLAGAVDLAYRVRGRVSPVCPARIDTILHGHRYDGTLAERELGIAYTPVSDLFARTIEWARREGLAPVSG